MKAVIAIAASAITPIATQIRMIRSRSRSGLTDAQDSIDFSFPDRLTR